MAKCGARVGVVEIFFSNFSTVSLAFSLPAQNMKMISIHPIFMPLGTTARVCSSCFGFGSTDAKFHRPYFSAKIFQKLSFIPDFVRRHGVSVSDVAAV